jgi:hypothetical protein
MKNENLLPFQKLDIYIAAKELARLVQVAKLRDRELRDQATSAAKSCFLCLSEGLPNDGAAMRQKYFVGAHAAHAHRASPLNGEAGFAATMSSRVPSMPSGPAEETITSSA